jgi:hypothetical protein
MIGAFESIGQYFIGPAEEEFPPTPSSSCKDSANRITIQPARKNVSGGKGEIQFLTQEKGGGDERGNLVSSWYSDFPDRIFSYSTLP